MDCYPINIFIDGEGLDDMLCPKCQGVMRNPTMDDCGHAFGESCLQGIMTNRQNCPISGNQLTTESALQTCNPLKAYIGRQTVKCMYSANCTWKGKLSDLDTHIAQDCLYLEVKCANQGCELKIPKKDLDDHKSICEYRTTVCESCNKELAHKQLVEHESICANKLLPCPNDCPEKIRLCDFDHHINLECTNKPVDCFARELGCKFQGSPPQIIDHLEKKSENFSHMSMILKALSEWRIEEQEFRTEVSSKIVRIEASMDQFASELKTVQLKVEGFSDSWTKSQETLVGQDTFEAEIRKISSSIASRSDEFNKLKENQKDLLEKISTFHTQKVNGNSSQEAKIDLGVIGSLIEKSLHRAIKPELLSFKDTADASIKELERQAMIMKRQINSINPMEFDIPPNSTSVSAISNKEVMGLEVGAITVGKSKMIPYQIWKLMILNKKSPHMAIGACLASKSNRERIRITADVEKQGCYFFFANGSQRINGVSSIELPDDQAVPFETGDLLEFSVDSSDRKITLKNANTQKTISVTLKSDDVTNDIYPFVHLWEKNESVKIIS